MGMCAEGERAEGVVEMGGGGSTQKPSGWRRSCLLHKAGGDKDVNSVEGDIHQSTSSL